MTLYRDVNDDLVEWILVSLNNETFLEPPSAFA